MRPTASLALSLSVGTAAVMALPSGSHAATCGAALLHEQATPAVIQGITLGPGTLARMWALGQASQAFSITPCASGCTSLSASPLCAEGGDCIALTGVSWLNATCQTAGTLPATTVFLVEGTTLDDGGRWAALALPHNAGDANTDLDAAATAVCGPECASVASPLVAGEGQPIQLVSASHVGTVITLHLAWTAPSATAQALNSGATLVSGYSVWLARSVGGLPPDLSGSTTGWTRVPDTDTSQVGGYSTNTAATVAIDTQGSSEGVWAAIGLVLDGSGDPDHDANARASSVISRGVLTFPQAPVFTSPASATFASGGMSAFTVTTTAIPAAAITKTGTLPKGLTFHDRGDGTALLSGIPGIGSPEVWPLTFTASNGGTDTTQDFTLTVTKGRTTTSVGSSRNPAPYGQAVRFTAKVSFYVRTLGVPTGTIQLAWEGGPIGAPVPLVSAQTSSLPVTLPIGMHTVTATYSGDASFAGSQAALAGGQEVNGP